MANEFQKTYEDIIRSLYAQSTTAGQYPSMQNYLMGSDGTFLGKITNNIYDANSIFNKYGQYGSRYSALSIFNKYGQYGSRYSALSPFNAYTSSPPKIFLDNNFIGYLTKNSYLSNAYEPDAFFQDIKDSQRFNY